MAKKEKKISPLAYIILVFLLFLLAVSLLRQGFAGMIINNVVRYFLGDYYYAIFIVLIAYYVYVCFYKKKSNLSNLSLGLLFAGIAILILGASFSNRDLTGKDYLDTFISHNIFKEFKSEEIIAYNGGLIGSSIYALSSYLFARSGTILLITALFILSFIFIVPATMIINYHREKMEVRQQNRQRKLQEKERIRLEKENRRLMEEIKPTPAKKPEQISIDAESFDNYSSPKPEIKKKKSVFLDISISGNRKAKAAKKEETSNTKITASTGPKRKYRLPTFSLLDPVTTTTSRVVNENAAKIKGDRIIEILNNFDIPCTLINTHVGPSVTKFEIKPESAIKINKIMNLADNIKMELAAKEVRIEAPIPGRSAVGIEIPNVESETVKMSELIKTMPADKKDNKLLFILGKGLLGQTVFCDLGRMPHLLIGGATGSGKSVCINSIIISLLYKCHPDEVKLILIDPKKVEFTPYHDIPHLQMPVITDDKEAVVALKRITEYMNDRFSLFAEVGVRDIDSYNKKVEANNADPEKPKMDKLPYLVVIIDELADLMILAKKEVEPNIQRITQLARACGIHLIVATQRPSVDVITGVIKSNIPSRIAFAVSSSTDSRTILDKTGAERLIGYGDMLYAPIGVNSPERVQGVYVSDKEIARITEFIKSQGVTPDYDDTYYEMTGSNTSGGEGHSSYTEKDSLYEEVKAYVIATQKASTSLVQRRFGVGVNRAGRIIDMLEDEHIIGPANGSKPREVYVKNEE
jgi:S-DNA-T family DNA segregation ATPase FtsK/SpoIIIE